MSKHNNSQVAHIWAQDNNESASGSHFFCEDGTIYSYGSHFPIARWTNAPNGERIVLFTTRGYSSTTARHISYTRQALRSSATVVYVANPGYEVEPKAWLKEQAEDIERCKKAVIKSRSHKDYKLSELDQEINRYNQFIELWKLRNKPYDLDEAWQAETQKAIAKQRQIEKEKQAKALEQAKATVEEWKAGAPVHIPACLGRVFLRSITRLSDSRADYGGRSDEPSGEILQTSKGAEVPLEHARRAFQQVLRCKTLGVEYKRNGHSIRVGHFEINRIEPNGNVTAGCHYIEFEEIEDFARRQGWAFEIAPASEISNTEHAQKD